MGSRTLAGAKLSQEKSRRPQGSWGLKGHGGSVGSQLPFSDILCFQAPEASNQASVSASSEWQRKLEAAEALLALRESS